MSRFDSMDGSSGMAVVVVSACLYWWPAVYMSEGNMVYSGRWKVPLPEERKGGAGKQCCSE